MAKFNLERIQDIINLGRQLAVGLRDMTFGDNFASSETTVTIAAGVTARLRHSLKVIPTRYIIVDQTGDGLVTRGATDWTDNHAYVINNGSVSVTITIIFLK